MDELLQRVAVSHLFPATGNSNIYHKDAGTPDSGAQRQVALSNFCHYKWHKGK